MSVNCEEKYMHFLNTDINEENMYDAINSLGECYQDITNVDEKIEVSDSFNPVDPTDKCKLISKKRQEYYRFTADPSNILNEIRSLPDSKYKKEYIKNINEMFNLKVRHNCCKCIAITLYCIECILDKYLFSIKLTIDRVKIVLPEYVVRLYLHNSVYQYVSSKKSIENQERKELLDKIFSSENVEIYTYVCENIINEKINIARTRIYRYVFTDPTVYVGIIREADGYVTNLDAHNIKLYEKNNTIMYIPIYFFPIKKEPITNLEEPAAYSSWLEIYYRVIFHKYYKLYTSYTDLLAGAVGFKMNIRNEYFKNIVNEINGIYNNFYRTFDDDIFKEFFRMLDIDERTMNNEKKNHMNDLINHMLDNNIMDADQIQSLIFFKKKYSWKTELKRDLNIGYDEILLAHLFKPIYAIKHSSIKNINNGQTEYIKEDFLIKTTFLSIPETYTTNAFSPSDETTKKIFKYINKSSLNFGHVPKPPDYSYPSFGGGSCTPNYNINYILHGRGKNIEYEDRPQDIVMIADSHIYENNLQDEFVNKIFDLHIIRSDPNRDNRILFLLNYPIYDSQKFEIIEKLYQDNYEFIKNKTIRDSKNNLKNNLKNKLKNKLKGKSSTQEGGVAEMYRINKINYFRL